jgi:hypothetical protein
MQLTRKISQVTRLNVKEELEAIILKMVDPDPARRGTASEMRRRLEQLFKRTEGASKVS